MTLFEGSEITLYYNPNNINEISTEKDIAHVIGWFCIGFGVLIIISSIMLPIYFLVINKSNSSSPKQESSATTPKPPKYHK